MKKIFKLSVFTASMIAATAGVAAPSNAQLSQQVRMLSEQTMQLQQEVHMLKAQQQLPHPKHKAAVKSGHAKSPLATRFDHPVTVTTSPLLGESTVGDASDFLVMTSKMNEDLTLLKQRSKLERELKAAGSNMNRPILELGGALEGQIYSIHGFNAGQDADASSEGPHGIALSTAELVTNAIVGPWVGGFMAIEYNNAPISTGNRQPNSTLELDRGFLTIGNLNRFPAYFSAGEMYVPFGKFGSVMLTTPLTQSIGRIRSAAAVVGVAKNGFAVQGYGYSGEYDSSNSKNVIGQGGLNVEYSGAIGNTNNTVQASASLVSNLADSQGMQNTGNNTTGQFSGFSQEGSTGNELAHRVPAIDLHTQLGLGHFTVIGEYLTGLRSFANSDLSYNNKGARVAAIHTEVDYTFHVKDKPVTLGASYGHSWDALALNLPQNSYAADLATSLFRNTIEQVEYRHDTNYGSSDVASGKNATANITGTGTTRNSVIGQIGVYF